jgi:hypothetical protein
MQGRRSWRNAQVAHCAGSQDFTKQRFVLQWLPQNCLAFFGIQHTELEEVMGAAVVGLGRVPIGCSASARGMSAARSYAPPRRTLTT